MKNRSSNSSITWYEIIDKCYIIVPFCSVWTSQFVYNVEIESSLSCLHTFLSDLSHQQFKVTWSYPRSYPWIIKFTVCKASHTRELAGVELITQLCKWQWGFESHKGIEAKVQNVVLSKIIRLDRYILLNIWNALIITIYTKIYRSNIDIECWCYSDDNNVISASCVKNVFV